MDSNNNLDSSNVVQNSSEVLSSSSSSSTNPNQSNNAAHSDSKSEEIKPLDTTLPMDEIKRMLQIQLEYYFSRDNLSHDTYLLSQMDSDQYVPIVTVANFDQVKKITRNMDLIVEVLKASQCVQVDPSDSKVRPITKRCILILREIPEETPQSEVEQLFDHKNCPKFVSCCFAHNNSWYIAFDSDGDAQRAFKYLREEVKYFNGKPIMTRIKNQPITATYSNFKAPGQPVVNRPAAAPLPQAPINPAAISSYATAANLIPNQETYASMQTNNPSLLNQRIPAYATLPQVPNYPNQAFPQFYPLIQQWPPTSYCDISTIFQINGLAACATIKHYNANNVPSTSGSNGAAGGAQSGRSGFSMRSGGGMHGNRKNSSNSNQGPHGRHNAPSTSLQAGTSSQQPLVSGASLGGSMASGSATGSNAINSNRLYNESNYLAEQQPAATGALNQTLYANNKSTYSATNRSNPANQSSLGSNGSNNLASGLAGGSASGGQLSGSRTSSYPPSSYRSSGYVNTGDYGYPKKKSPNELATTNSTASGRGGSAADHSHYSSGGKNATNSNSQAGLLNSNTSNFNQKSSTRELDQKSVSSASSLKASRNNNSRGKKSPRDEALLPSTHAYADHHGYHSQNVYNNPGYRESGSRGGHEGGRREPRAKNRTEPTGYVNSSAAATAKEADHHKQFDLQATAFPPLPGAAKPGDSGNQAANQTAVPTPSTSSTTKPAAGKSADHSHADGTSGCLADVVKGVKVQRESTGKSTDEADSQSSANSKKGQKPANHSLNSSALNSSTSANRSTDEGKPAKGCSATASCPPATVAAVAASNHHPNASQVDSYANLASNMNSQVPAKSNKPSAQSGGKTKGDQLSDGPLNEPRAADSSSVRSTCSYSSTADSQRSGESPASRSKLSIDSNASSIGSQPVDRLVAATGECTLNGHLDEKCNSKKLMSYSDVAKLLKGNGGENGSDNGVSPNDCSQNSSASGSNSNVNSLNTPLNKSALDSKDREHRDGKKLLAKRDFLDSGSHKEKNRESRSNRPNTNYRERREKKDWVYGEKQAKVN